MLYLCVNCIYAHYSSWYLCALHCSHIVLCVGIKTVYYIWTLSTFMTSSPALLVTKVLMLMPKLHEKLCKLMRMLA